MSDIYPKKTLIREYPSFKTIQYLLNYSKQLRVIETKTGRYIQLNMN